MISGDQGARPRDDLVAVGECGKVKAFKDALAKRFTVKSKIVVSCLGENEVQEARVFNRVIRWTPEGWQCEADQQHAELIIQAMGLKDGKLVKMPGEEEPTWKIEDSEK